MAKKSTKKTSKPFVQQLQIGKTFTSLANTLTGKPAAAANDPSYPSHPHVINITISITNNASREVTCKWGTIPSKYKYFDTCDVIWRIHTPSNGLWSDGTSTNGKSFSVYTVPANVDKVLCKVKPKQKKKYKGKSIASKDKWKATGWTTSAYVDLGIKEEIPDPPTLSNLRIEGSDLICDVENYRYEGGQVQFEILKDATVKVSTGVYVDVLFNRATLRYPVEEGHKYSVRARGIYKGNVGITWSDWTSDVSAAPGKVKTLYDIETLPVIEGESVYRVKLRWDKASNVDDPATDYYEIQYTTNPDYFDVSPDDVKTAEARDEGGRVIPLQLVITLNEAKQWYFRVRGVNKGGQGDQKGAWSEIKSASPGQKPDAPTTWTYTSSAKIGSPIIFNWTHNSLDGSKQTGVRINLTINGAPITPIELTTADKSYSYPTTGLPDNTTILWTVQTKGNYSTADDPGYSDPSVQREVKVYIAPTVQISLGIEADDETFSRFPMSVNIAASPPTQQLISMDFAIVSESSYTDTDETGHWYHVGIGDYVYQRRVDSPDSNVIEFELTPADVNLASGVDYKAVATIYMDSGLSANGEQSFMVSFVDEPFDVRGSVEVNLNALTALITPRCEDEWGLVLQEGATLAVYRQNSDGSYTEIDSNIPMGTGYAALDPHPTLDYARYRVTATSIATGHISYADLAPEPVHVNSIVIQWLDEWNYVAQDELESSASMLVLPYNVDVSDTNSQDVELVEYIGRENPVSYYGTQKGYTSNWKCDIRKDDMDTLYKIRQLARYPGDVYVREPNGTGYWANVRVQYTINHNTTTIPVSFSITKVEGGR